MDELAYLLWCTQGIKESHEPYATFRTVPSAGGRHAFETYLQINRVSDMLPASGRDIVLTIDLSGSMQKEDFSLDGQPISRRWDQPGNGGGNWYAFTLAPRQALGHWQPLDDEPAMQQAGA